MCAGVLLGATQLVHVQACVVGLAVLGGYRCRTRIVDWSNESALFESAVLVCPNSAKIRMQFAKVHPCRV